MKARNGGAGEATPLAAAETRILFVTHVPGDDIGAASHGRFGPDVEVVSFSALSPEMLRAFKPHFVVSPILTPGFDILDLGLKLWQLRFRGAYRVLTEVPLPDPGLVLREVRLQCPGLDIDILNVEVLRG